MKTVITRRPETFELVVERGFAAPPERLWRAWTTPEVARWWGPHGWRAEVHEMDVRPGGRWRYSIVPDAGDEPPVRCTAVYRTLAAPAELAFDDGLADEDGDGIAPGTAVRVTVAIEPRDGGAHLAIITRYADAAHFATAGPSGMDTGLAEALDRLAAHLI
ncbi:SRPBCC domain-containing protein [Actinomadura kijaniata]|uniref:Uncharacterized protein YndB with AHSA1/START domain n=1 Tax=Actinomadura namibiensis TaxID=182080 RepID=A0A7W3LWH9_ACTNM|nr:SRPBCC domain-containing protein [Actinomadura namibiensis]MBA8955613.1 uncharacterized protein YndB with AHSA1/START domain [Actinomadura namibiensis]